MFRSLVSSAAGSLSRSANCGSLANARSGALRFASTRATDDMLHQQLQVNDPEMFDIIEREKNRQKYSLCLIPSENFTSRAVLDTLGSVMQNKYSEGYPNARYYGGNEFIDMSELLCQKRALHAFGVDADTWGVNVQPLSGSPANFYVYTALLKPHDRIMSLDLPHGGHLSHGYQTPTKKVSAVPIYFDVLPYRLNESTGYVDYDKLEENAQLYRPKLLVSGASAYSRHWDYARLRKIADSVGAYLLFDMAHVSGLVAAGEHPSPFEFCDVVTTTTHKSLRGPRGSMIFFRKKLTNTDKKGNVTVDNLEEKINGAVFPGHQGGPHNHTIAALAVALKQAASPEFKHYQRQVVQNSKHLTQKLISKGYQIVSGGTDNHLCLVDLRDKNVDGSYVQHLMELSNVALNKNTVPGDRNAMQPGGIRMGTPAMTTRGLVESDFDQVAEFLDRGIQLAASKKAALNTKFKGFKQHLAENPQPEIDQLKSDIGEFCSQFPVIGFDGSSMTYP